MLAPLGPPADGIAPARVDIPEAELAFLGRHAVEDSYLAYNFGDWVEASGEDLAAEAAGTAENAGEPL